MQTSQASARQSLRVAQHPQYDGIFRKSTFSASGNCVEVAKFKNGGIKVRDSKHAGGPTLSFNQDEWQAFLQGIQHGEFTA